MKRKTGFQVVLSSFAIAVGFMLGPVTSYATEQAQQRREARDTRQEGRQEARETKQECRAGDEKSRPECRQDKRETKQDTRQQARDIKY